MFHKWIDIKNIDNIVNIRNKTYSPIRCKKCIKCNLLKGILFDKRIPNIIYFNENKKLLSIGILPYKCFEPLIKEEDFLI